MSELKILIQPGVNTHPKYLTPTGLQLVLVLRIKYGAGARRWLA